MILLFYDCKIYILYHMSFTIVQMSSQRIYNKGRNKFYYFTIEQLFSLRQRLVYAENHPVHRIRTDVVVDYWCRWLLLCSPLTSSSLTSSLLLLRKCIILLNRTL